MSGDAPDEGYRYAQVGSCVVVTTPVVGDRMSYPGTLTREQAAQIFGEHMVESIDKWVEEETAAAAQPFYQPLVGYRLYRSHNSTERGREVGRFGKRGESFAQIFRSKR